MLLGGRRAAGSVLQRARSLIHVLHELASVLIYVLHSRAGGPSMRTKWWHLSHTGSWWIAATVALAFAASAAVSRRLRANNALQEGESTSTPPVSQPFLSLYMISTIPCRVFCLLTWLPIRSCKGCNATYACSECGVHTCIDCRQRTACKDCSLAVGVKQHQHTHACSKIWKNAAVSIHSLSKAQPSCSAS